MTNDDREQACMHHLFHTADYFAAVRAAGDLPWFAAGQPRRDEVVEKLGLPEDISEIDLRRALFERRYHNHQEESTA